MRSEQGLQLVESRWLRVRGSSGRHQPLSALEIADVEVLDLAAPRPDFHAAQAQFLLGLLQTALAPDDEDAWLERWHTPPTADELRAAFAPWADALVLDAAAGPAFLQDFAPTPDFRPKDIGELLIDRGSEANLHFASAQPVTGLCPGCTASALFALQANAPSGGVGHRVSMRGGGPLTTLLLPPETPAEPATLWQRLWLNVLPADDVRQPGGRFKGKGRAAVMPWLAPTRTSEQKNGQTTPADAHPLQAYWGMPRRLRLDPHSTVAGRCSVCGEPSERLFTRYLTKNYGISYEGWLHPLTPYLLDPKNKTPPLSVKGQKGGIGYRHWPSLVLGIEGESQPAQVVRHYIEGRWSRLGHNGVPRLWACGFDLDNMKARCWYDATLPVHALADPAQAPAFAAAVQALLGVADEAARQLRSHVKQAWARRPADLKDEPEVMHSFWRATEPAFYRSLEQLQARATLRGPRMADIGLQWHETIRHEALRLFDGWTEGQAGGVPVLDRLVTARHELEKWLDQSKPMKAFRQRMDAHRQETA